MELTPGDSDFQSWGSRRGNTEGYGDAVQPSSGQEHGLWNPTNWIAVTVQFLLLVMLTQKNNLRLCLSFLGVEGEKKSIRI